MTGVATWQEMGRSVGNRGGMSRESRVLRGISTDRNLTLWVTKGEERLEERGIKGGRNNRKKRDKRVRDELPCPRTTRKGGKTGGPSLTPGGSEEDGRVGQNRKRLGRGEMPRQLERAHLWCPC